MTAHMLGGLSDLQSGSALDVADLARVVTKDAILATRSSTELDLQSLQWGARSNGLKQVETDIHPPQTPRELEQSVPSTPQGWSTDAILQTATNPPKNRWRLIAAAIVFFNFGMNDGVTGALIPYLESQYRVGYAVVSLVFVANALGFITAAPSVSWLESRLGKSRTYMCSFSCISAAYIALACDPPFPLVVVSFFVSGLGYAFHLAMTNSWVVTLVNGTTLLGVLHGMYGLGGVASPLIATAMVSRGTRWSFFYLIPLGLALLSVAFMGWAFSGYEHDSTDQRLTELDRTASWRIQETSQPAKGALLKQSLKSRTTRLGAVFIFAYQGGEVAISGWVISFLIHYRQGNPAHVGNVTSGFWGGITAARFLLTHLCHKIGEKRSVYCLVMGAGVFQLLVWLTPNIVGDAVAEAIVGLFLGPVYPCATAIFGRLLPKDIRTSSLGIVASMGSSGGAIAPFLTGLLAQRLGTAVLHPICLVLFFLMEISWFALPKLTKRKE